MGTTINYLADYCQQPLILSSPCASSGSVTEVPKQEALTTGEKDSTQKQAAPSLDKSSIRSQAW